MHGSHHSYLFPLKNWGITSGIKWHLATAFKSAPAQAGLLGSPWFQMVLTQDVGCQQTV